MKPFTLEWWMDLMLDYIHRSKYLERKDRLKHFDEIIRLSDIAQWIEQRIINKYGED